MTFPYPFAEITLDALAKRGSKFQAPFPGFEEVVLRDNAPTPSGITWAIHLSSWVMPHTNAFANVKARVQVGSEGGSDDFLVDYPKSGTAFCVQGAQLTVSIVGADLGVEALQIPDRPILGAWLVQVASGHNRPQNARFTTPIITIAQGAGGGFPVPGRARAFRVDTISPAGAAPLDLLQLDSRPSPRDLLRDTTSFVATVLGNSLDIGLVLNLPPTARSQWFPLHPDAASLVLTNRSAGDIGLSVQFLLETCA